MAGTSFALQLVAARSLGADGLGRFTLLTAVLIAWNALQTGWVGDSLTVLDRFDPGTRAALVRSQQLATVLALLLPSAAVAAFGLVEPDTALLFGVAVALWGLEDTCRRLLMARIQFWSLVVNDAAYALAVAATLVASALAGRATTLGTLVAAMAVGAGVAVVVGVAQLPARELRPGPRAPADLRALSTFALWRAAQVGVGPTAQWLLRVVVAAVASTAGLGRLEAARLLVAPVQAVVTGAGTLILPLYAEAVRTGTFSRRSVHTAMVVLAGGSAAVGAVAVAGADPLGDLLTGGAFTVEPLAVASWALLVAAMGAAVPASLAVVAHQRSRSAFQARATSAALGLVLTAALVAAASVALAPAGLALGTALGAAWLLRTLGGKMTLSPPVS